MRKLHPRLVALLAAYFVASLWLLWDYGRWDLWAMNTAFGAAIIIMFFRMMLPSEKPEQGKGEKP